MYTILIRLLVFFCLSAILAGAFFWCTPLIKLNEEMHRALLNAELELDMANETYLKLAEELAQIQFNPRKVEKYVREGFRYAKPDETVFIFETVRPSVTIPLKP